MFFPSRRRLYLSFFRRSSPWLRASCSREFRRMQRVDADYPVDLSKVTRAR